MIGAIAGDMIGSVYEFYNVRTTIFPLFSPRSFFTDDTVMTIATAKAILTDGNYGHWYGEFGRSYPDAGYGGMFRRWLWSEDPQPYNSFGNGSAMRVSPVGFAFNDEGEVLEEAAKSAAVTHNHPEGIKGAQATALAILRCRQGVNLVDLRLELAERFGYDLTRTTDQIRPGYAFNETCQATVPEALTAFFESTSFEHALRLAVSLGGDSDTLACITGGIAQAFYQGVPEEIEMEVRSRLPKKLVSIADDFIANYVDRKTS
ncbi:MAG TPA: ADP-ribosylglycohydrolase family protein [Longilinea sp.]|nr:ADP-ribosylglycohydrolase family protein [Longilinea sp.]